MVHTEERRALEPSEAEESISQKKNSKYKEKSLKNVEGERDKISVVLLEGNLSHDSWWEKEQLGMRAINKENH